MRNVLFGGILLKSKRVITNMEIYSGSELDASRDYKLVEDYLNLHTLVGGAGGRSP